MLNLLQALEESADRAASMPGAGELAERLKVSMSSVYRDLAELCAAGHLERLLPGGGERSGSYRLTRRNVILVGALVRRSERRAPVRVHAPQDEGASECRERRCLRCREGFLSAHKGNRICDSCKSQTDFNPAIEDFRVAAR